MYFTPGWAAILAAGSTLSGIVITQTFNLIWSNRTRGVDQREKQRIALVEAVAAADHAFVGIDAAESEIRMYSTYNDEDEIWEQIASRIRKFREEETALLNAIARAELVIPSAKTALDELHTALTKFGESVIDWNRTVLSRTVAYIQNNGDLSDEPSPPDVDEPRQGYVQARKNLMDTARAIRD
ncbi:hypothetical protein ACH47B_32310 [Rhodococcus sp. NPDC019627]|uniref:Uncharacterized protein n=1 Tax=Rhodococcus opacus (strain B4) TaxID=632772 RepID=C1BDG2_RHOOB|nr:hypothetical protein [Rhodococcus opacus]BAH47015.1 hypothetical protein ROP_pROB02-00020 [Rhodococcus opacus B4]